MTKPLSKTELLTIVRALGPSLAPSSHGAQDERLWFNGSNQPAPALWCEINKHRDWLVRELGGGLRPRRQLGDTAGAWVPEGE